MNRSLMPQLNRIAFLGSFPPRACGIATFTADLRTGVARAAPDAACFVAAMTDSAGPYEYPPEVRLDVSESDPGAYARAAALLNDLNADVLCLQHEYGIFGGPDGSMLLRLLERVRMPVITTLHTVLERPSIGQRRVLEEIIRHSIRLVVMTRRSRDTLHALHGVPNERIALIPHGIPDTPFLDPAAHRGEIAAAGRTVLLTFGLLSPGKGIEHAIQALPAIVARHPEVLYYVVGATHPNLRRREGEAYRRGLSALAAELGVAEHLRLSDRFIDLPKLTRVIAAADIYLTPYVNEEQSVSGTLAYSFGMGKAVVSTPYFHATELLADGRGVLVPFRDPPALAEAVLRLLDDPARMRAMQRAAYAVGREFVWPRIGERYLEVFGEAREDAAAYRLGLQRGAVVSPRPVALVSASGPSKASPVASSAAAGGAAPAELPTVRFGHLSNLLDSTGIAQHATHAVPDRAHGYCLDDNARGLLLAALLPRLPSRERRPDSLGTRTAAFVQHAWNGQKGRFRNFMSYDRRWLEDVGSEDSHGRALWALGALAAATEEKPERSWSAALLEEAAAAAETFRSPRAWAFSILGLTEYLRARPEDRRLGRLRAELCQHLCASLPERGAEWLWFEDVLTYDNARLPQALIMAGLQAKNPEWGAAGRDSLEWLCNVHRAESGHFRPIGSNGFWRRGGPRARFDQQPLEAAAAVSACLAAWQESRSLRWLAEARRAYEWFTGSNDLGEPLIDAQTGACCDGLLCDRVNANQGAESTLAFLLATVEMRIAHADVIQPKPDETARAAW
jgi:glycosyltransferase involved in cell wall biosynthesis